MLEPMMPKVSVIIPLYNKAPYVRKAVESVLAQSYKDWELVVVNDGSTDGSDKIVSEYIDEQVRIVSQDNLGVSTARNKGVELAKAELIAFLDADDWWDERFLEEMIAFAEAYPNAGLWACNYWYVKRGKTRVAVKQKSGYFDYAESYLRNEAMPVWTGAVVMRKNVFDKEGGFPAGIKIGEDFLLWSKIALSYPIAFLNKALAYYNNDVPATARATRNLCPPEQHMLFHLDSLAEQSETWKALCDKLRADGLLKFWLSEEFHHIATQELTKIDLKKQPLHRILPYHIPIWLDITWLKIKRIGGIIKQKMR